MAYNSTVSLFHADKWRLSFSNIPTVTNVQDMALFDQFARSITIPEYTMEINRTFEHLGYQIQNPATNKANINLPDVPIEFKLCDNFKNYYYLWKWMNNLKYGSNKINTRESRMYYCNEIRAEMLDNEKRTMITFRFTKCFCVGLSSISLGSGTGEEVSFIGTFSHEQFLLEPNSNVICTT